MGYFKILATPVRGPKPFSVTDFLRDTLQRRPNLCLAYSFLVVTGQLLDPIRLSRIEAIQDHHENEVGRSTTFISQHDLDTFGVDELNLDTDVRHALNHYGHTMIIYPVPGQPFDHAIAAFQKPDDPCVYVTTTSPLSPQGLPTQLRFQDQETFIRNLEAKTSGDFQALCYPLVRLTKAPV